MAAFISILLPALAVLVAIPVAIFFGEIVAAIALPQRERDIPPSGEPRPRVVVLVPAHNESTGLVPTLSDIKGQLNAADRVLVVADNCTDDTAAVAAAAGADVVARDDPNRRGKGYALACGIRHLDADPPEMVIVLDADCRLADAAIDRLAAACASTNRPVQSLDLMIAPDQSPINTRVAEFAWRVKNWVRPLGLKALGLPCQLMGTGMAFPWDIIRSADLASGLIVEDLKLGLDLALARNSPVFCPSARVTSEFPLTIEGVQTQRLRWEKGHIGMILTAAPRLVIAALMSANLDLLLLALDVMVPPLSLLGFLVVVTVVIGGFAMFLGFSSATILISLSSLMIFTIGMFLSWLRFGRDILPLGAILLFGSYAAGKLPLYRKMFSRESGSRWIRTDRGKL